jgi:hypothetical protein
MYVYLPIRFNEHTDTIWEKHEYKLQVTFAVVLKWLMGVAHSIYNRHGSDTIIINHMPITS